MGLGCPGRHTRIKRIKILSLLKLVGQEKQRQDNCYTYVLQGLTINRLKLNMYKWNKKCLGQTKMVIGHTYSSADLENDIKIYGYFWHMFTAVSEPPRFLTAGKWML